MVWELVFMMVILKIPILYACGVVWWAIRAEPEPLEGALLPVAEAPEPWPARSRRRHPRRGPERTPSRGVRVQRAAVRG